MVDPARVRALLARLGERRERLSIYGERSPEEYLENEEAVAASKYLLITAIEDVLSVANHVVASEGYRSPVDYADAFAVLRDQDVLEEDLAERLMAMARFRNLLVHQYVEIDDRRVYAYLREDLADFDAFAAAVLDAFPELG